jgi:colanic acid/amylovoran biosynthesis glycosyltransferase
LSLYEERQPLKIAFIVTTFPGLSQTFILNQITGLLDLGHDVEIFAGRRDSKVHPCVEKYQLMKLVHYLPQTRILMILKAIWLIIVNFHKSPFTIFKLLDFNKYRKGDLSLSSFFYYFLFGGKKFDIIHCHFGPNGIIGAQLKKLGIPGKIITTFHGYDMSTFLLIKGLDIYKDLFLNGELFLPISENWKRKLIELDCDEKKIAVHRMGIDLKKFKYLKRNIKPNESVKILTIGRLVEKKGYEYAIRAIARVTDIDKHISYIIGGDGPLRKKLEDLITELNINDYVKIMGAVDQNEVLRLYEQAHFMVLPSITAKNGDKEGIPVVLMESSAIGLPVISTYHSGIPEVIDNGKSGFLVPEKDVCALAEKIEYLVKHPEIWEEMGNNGRKIIEERYDIKKLNRQLVDIYQNLIKDKLD